MIFVWRGLYLRLDKFRVNSLGPKLRSWGQSIYKFGAKIQGEYFTEDTLVPSQRCIPVSDSKFPKLLASEWVAPNCTMIGDITTGKFTSFYHGVVLRGDTCRITIGNKTVIQDNSVLMNTDLDNKFAEISIGEKVLIGVNCFIDNCRIDDSAMISDGATIHKGCHIQAGAMVAAGTVLPPNTTVPSGQIFAGNPGKYLRDLKADEVVSITENQVEMRELANVMVEHTEQSHIDLINQYRQFYSEYNMESDERIVNRMRVFAQYTDGVLSDDFGVESCNMKNGFDEWENEGFMKFFVGKNFKKDNMDLHYEQDLTHYPDAFKIYGENYKHYDSLKKKFENEIPGESPGWPIHSPPQRPGAMRAWVSKWDPDTNIQYKPVGNKLETLN